MMLISAQRKMGNMGQEMTGRGAKVKTANVRSSFFSAFYINCFDVTDLILDHRRQNRDTL